MNVKCDACRYLMVCYGQIPYPLRILCPGESAVTLADCTLPGRRIAKVSNNALPSPDNRVDHSTGSPALSIRVKTAAYSRGIKR